MASIRYIEQKRKRNSERGRYGNAVKAQRRIAKAEKMRVVGKVVTSGSLGDHTIELLDCGESMVVWVRVDGKIKRPRTARGFVSLLGRWIWKAGV